MCNAWNHPPGCTCGWGGEGHLGSAYGHVWHGGMLGDPFQHPGLLRQIAVRHRISFSIPTKCWYCGQQIYIYANEYGSVVLFDELGWPWPKHDCPNAPADLKGDSLRRPAAFMARMPAQQSRWFQGVLESLEAEGKDSSYAAVAKIPQAVLNGQYDSQRPTLEFLRHLSQANRLRRGIFLPLPCASCTADIWAYVPTSGDPYIAEVRGNGSLRPHRCGTTGTSRVSIVRACLPRTLSWREVEVRLRAASNRWRITKPDETVIGFVTDHIDGHLRIKTFLGDVVSVPSSVKHPVYTLVVSAPDPFKPGDFVIRAPTIEQFIHGLPGSMPPILSQEALQAAKSPLATKSLPRETDTPKPVIKPNKVEKPKAPVIPRYPPEFDRPEVVTFLKTVSATTLSEENQQRWAALEVIHGWHLGGLVPQNLAQQFSAPVKNAEEKPEQRAKYLSRLTRVGREIALKVKKQLK